MVSRTFMSVDCMHSQRKPTYVLPGMAGREMATVKGHGEMETGTGWRAEKKEVGMATQGVARGT